MCSELCILDKGGRSDCGINEEGSKKDIVL